MGDEKFWQEMSELIEKLDKIREEGDYGWHLFMMEEYREGDETVGETIKRIIDDNPDVFDSDADFYKGVAEELDEKGDELGEEEFQEKLSDIL